MNPIRLIRDRLGLSQGALGEKLKVDASNISNYERGKCRMPPAVAELLIEEARQRGLRIDYNQIYGLTGLPEAPVVVEKQAPAPAVPQKPAGPKRHVIYQGGKA